MDDHDFEMGVTLIFSRMSIRDLLLLNLHALAKNSEHATPHHHTQHPHQRELQIAGALAAQLVDGGQVEGQRVEGRAGVDELLEDETGLG